MNLFGHLKLAVSVAENLPDVFFHLGYQRVALPRWFRRLASKTVIHRVWLSGYSGGFLGSVIVRDNCDTVHLCSDPDHLSGHNPTGR